jgi:dihydroneopterin aldolase
MQENTLGQKFVVDAVLWADIAKSGRTDSLDDTLDYRKVYRCASTCSKWCWAALGSAHVGTINA